MCWKKAAVASKNPAMNCCQWKRKTQKKNYSKNRWRRWKTRKWKMNNCSLVFEAQKIAESEVKFILLLYISAVVVPSSKRSPVFFSFHLSLFFPSKTLIWRSFFFLFVFFCCWLRPCIVCFNFVFLSLVGPSSKRQNVARCL